MSTEIPFILALDFAADNLVIGLVAFAIALTIHAEAQGFLANMFRCVESGQEKRFFTFNPLAHLYLPALAAFVFCGFGWARRIDPVIVPRRGSHRLWIQLAGPIANLLLANIISSILLVLGKMDPDLLDEKALNILMATNVSFAVYNLMLPLPPLAAGNILSSLFKSEEKEKAAYAAGILMLLSIFLFEFMTGNRIVSGFINTVTREVFLFIKP